MEVVIDFLFKNWVLVTGLLSILVGPALFTKLKEKVLNFKLPTFKSTSVNTKDVISEDIKAITWLADRAVDVNDQELILDIEGINEKFYHIHRSMRKSASNSGAKSTN